MCRKMLLAGSAGCRPRTLGNAGRGFTTVELIVVAALVVLALGSWIALAVTSRGQEHADERRGEYDRLLSSLDEQVHRDLRSCVEARAEGTGVYVLRILRTGPDGNPEETTVSYRTRDDGKVVERESDEGVQTHDFRPLLDGKDFVFQLRF